MRNRPVAALRHIGKVGVLRKLREQRRVEKRNPPLVQRDAVQQTDDAFRHRTQFVAALCREHNARRLRPAVGGPYDIIALIVFLEHEAPATRDDHAVNVPLPINDEPVEPRRKVRHKASLIGRYRLPFEGCRGTRGDGRRAKRSSTEQKVAAIEHGTVCERRAESRAGL